MLSVDCHGTFLHTKFGIMGGPARVHEPKGMNIVYGFVPGLNIQDGAHIYWNVLKLDEWNSNGLLLQQK